MWYYIQAFERSAYAPVAQLDRVTDYESVGRGFESLLAYQKQDIPFGMSCFCLREGTRTIQCGSPVDCRQTPAGRRLLLSAPSPFWRTARMTCFPGTSVGPGQGSCRKNVRVYKQIVPNMCFFILYPILFCGIVEQSLNKITVAERRWSGESEECAERDSR